MMPAFIITGSRIMAPIESPCSDNVVSSAGMSLNGTIIVYSEAPLQLFRELDTCSGRRGEVRSGGRRLLDGSADLCVSMTDDHAPEAVVIVDVAVSVDVGHVAAGATRQVDRIGVARLEG